MNLLSLPQSLIPSRSASNPSKPARPPLAGAMLEKLEDRVLLSAVALSTDKSAAKAYREMIMGAAGGEIYMPLSSASSGTPAVGIIAWSQAEPKPIIIEGRTARGGFGIFRDGDLRQPLTVNYQITGGTADGGDHTLSQSGSVTIKRGRRGVRLPVQAADDAAVEGNETLVVGLTPGEGYALGSSSSAALTVGDDDAVPDLLLNGLSEEQEENPGAILAVGAERIPLMLNLEGSVRFGSKAILSIASGADKIRVWSAQSGGQLLLDADRLGKKWKGENLPSTLWIEAAAPSQSSGDIALTLSFYANPFVTVPATDTVKVTIPPVVWIEETDPLAAEPEAGIPADTATFTLRREGLLAQSLDVYYAVSGTATEGDGTPDSGDYDRLPGTPGAGGHVHRVSFAAGEAATTIIVTPVEDEIFEDAESIIITLLEPETQPGVLPPYILAATPASGPATKPRRAEAEIEGNIKIDVKGSLKVLEPHNWKLVGGDDATEVIFEVAKVVVGKEPAYEAISPPGSTAKVYDAKAKVIGYFHVRAKATINGQVRTTAKKLVTVDYPTAADILAGQGVRAEMDEAWGETKDFTRNDEDHRLREQGFWISLDTQEEKYKFSDTIFQNPPSAFNTNPPPGITLGNKPATVPADPKFTDTPTYTLAFFHTHTPMEFVPPAPPPGVTSRRVGPSPADIDHAEKNSYKGFVYDYVTNTVDDKGKKVVVAGTPIDAAATVYIYNP